MKKGITLTEIIAIVVVILLLTAFSLPRYFRLKQEGKEIAESGVVGGIRAGIYSYVAQNQTWPTQLDSAPTGSKASHDNRFFTMVYPQGGIDKGWTKDPRSENLYHSPADNMYEYNPVTGEFLKLNF
ncbi:MAG: type II secretion system protein [Candidatus Omnitrophica bacterium]|nr:type II secretion system protein [Candidatus Omnitrophota bacterium]